MKKNIKLDGENIYLRSVKISDATGEYVDWLNDSEVNKFLEIRFQKHTLEGVKEYIESMENREDMVFLAIIRRDSGKHIGNIKLGPINIYHKFAEIGIMIGDKNSWGKGYATEAIKLLSDYAFSSLSLHKVTAGAYSNNLGSIKAFLKLGFVEEGRKARHFNSNGEYVDDILLAKFSEIKS